MRNPFKRAKKITQTDSAVSENGLPVAAIDNDTGMTEKDRGDVEGRLVVMGHESMFSSEVIDYAIDMAQRMSYEILALNSAPLSCDAFNLLSTSQKKLCQEFKNLSEKSAMSFRRRAEDSGIPFTHVVKFDEPEAALTNVQREYGNIEFVISEQQTPSTVNRIADSNRPRSEMLVYSMI
jgi:hypothetical protein